MGSVNIPWQTLGIIFLVLLVMAVALRVWMAGQASQGGGAHAHRRKPLLWVEDNALSRPYSDAGEQMDDRQERGSASQAMPRSAAQSPSQGGQKASAKPLVGREDGSAQGRKFPWLILLLGTLFIFFMARYLAQ